MSRGRLQLCMYMHILYFFYKIYEPSREITQQFGFPTRSDTDRSVLSQKDARSLKLKIYVVEEWYYPQYPWR